jgi:sodium/bile acid cotransporter 7
MTCSRLRGSLLTITTVLLVAFLAPALPADDGGDLKIVYGMYAGYKAEAFPQVADITPQAAMSLLDAGEVVFVDTRQPAESAVSMLPGAITREQFLARPAAYADKTPVFYCTIGYRSGVFARDTALKGITVYNLAGGILAWTLEGGRIFDADGETRRLHVYGKKWDYAPRGYETVTFGWLQQLLN